MRGFKNSSLAIVVLAVLGLFAGCADMKKQAETPAAHLVKILETDEGFFFTEGGQKVLLYQRKPKSLDGKYTRADYVHPLYGLDGEILTEDFPADHPHHRGIFWAWHQIYVGGKKLGDGWSTQDISWDVYETRILAVDSQSRALRAQVFWKSPLWTDAGGKQKPFVKETTTITVHRTQGHIRKIDFEISLLALEDGVRIGGAENKKAYGGFSPRIRLPDGLSFTGPAGPVQPRGTPIDAGPWLDFSGRFGHNDKLSGLAVLCHKSNPGYPQPWCLRRKGSMQNAVWPGQYPVPLSREKPITLRYRLIIHRENAHDVNLNQLQTEYESENY
ncbi:MAG: DUF6807 family protein [Planctomycetota bacterium]|jgi:hypothetical protein